VIGVVDEAVAERDLQDLFHRQIRPVRIRQIAGGAEHVIGLRAEIGLHPDPMLHRHFGGGRRRLMPGIGSSIVLGQLDVPHEQIALPVDGNEEGDVRDLVGQLRVQSRSHDVDLVLVPELDHTGRQPVLRLRAHPDERLPVGSAHRNDGVQPLDADACDVGRVDAQRRGSKGSSVASLPAMGLRCSSGCSAPFKFVMSESFPTKGQSKPCTPDGVGERGGTCWCRRRCGEDRRAGDGLRAGAVPSAGGLGMGLTAAFLPASHADLVSQDDSHESA
jgi:hypothetical protein